MQNHDDAQTLPPELLLIIFIHGFKGTDSTFAQFPERLRHVLSQTVDNLVVESIAFPAYETKGELNEAVERFADWLTTLTVEREVANGTGGGAGKAKIVLCGHSMGGLVAADTLLNLASSRPDTNAPLWPNVIACIAFDTPYLGLHPFVFKHGATKAMEYVQTAQKVASSFGFFSSVSSSKRTEKASVGVITAPPPAASASSKSSWANWAPVATYGVGGALLSGALAGTAYYQKDKLGFGYSWATDHMKYVGTLWDEEKLKRRLRALAEVAQTLNVSFRAFYNLLPPRPLDHPDTRTFCILPEVNSELRAYFTPTQNTIASDEVEAHVGMFEASTNDGYYELGLASAQVIRESIMAFRGTFENEAAIDDARSEAEDILAEDMAPEELKRQSVRDTDVKQDTASDLIDL